MPDKRRAAILVTNGFEQVELVEPRDALIAAGVGVDIVSLKKEKVRGWSGSDWGDEFDVDLHIEDARAGDYGLLVLPGGVMNPDFLRMDARAVEFVRRFVASGKPVGAICHGPWTLIEAGVVRGRRLTSYNSLRTDLTNAGAEWVDDEVVVDGNLISSRRPEDLPAFCRALVSAVQKSPAHAAAE
ncbi:MAG TPA: type 1 glutamine amidotransferase domain-containing protein [Polyangiaceae bacterium]|nr:type 1 glutamine amidotransferase domain-containing protein [Polyangiaceae bacterium]